jgi:hypothetical protein
LFLFAASGYTEEYRLTKDGKADCAVIIGQNAGPVEKHASLELRNYLKKISGTEVAEAVGFDRQSKLYPLYLATPETCPVIKEFGLEDKMKGLSDEGFVIKADKQGLVIAGKKPVGVLYGAYTFLEDYLGLRWYHPGEDGEYCPKKPSLTVSAIDETQNPAMTYRTVTFVACPFNGRYIKEWDWMVRNKMQIYMLMPTYYSADCLKDLKERGAMVDLGGHKMFWLVPEETYFKDHPEYFALINGKRTPYSADPATKAGPGCGGAQPCTSNPEVVAIAARRIIKYFKEEGGESFLIGNNDAGAWCECDKCRAHDDPNDLRESPVSTRFYKFANAVTEKVLKECPDKKLSAWAYQGFSRAPRGVKPDPRLTIQRCVFRCYRHALNDPNCPMNVKETQLLKEWAAFGNPISLYEYYCDIFGGAYVPLEEIIAKDIKYEASIGCKGWAGAEISPSQGLWQGFPTFYIAAKLLWDPKLDPEKVMADLNEKCYGPAAADIKAYRDLLTKTWESTDGHVWWLTPSLVALGKCLNEPGLQEKLLQLLATAASDAPGNDAVQMRIALEKGRFGRWQHECKNYQKSPVRVDVHAVERQGQIKIDGVLDEPAWSKASEIFFGSSMAGTGVKVLYDTDYVYFGVTCLTGTNTVKGKHVKRDDDMWDEDIVEFFIDPIDSGAKYFHVAVNSRGTLYDSECTMGNFMGDRSFNSGSEAASSVIPGKWIMEMKIKGDSLKGASIYRGGYWKLSVNRDNSSWSDGAYHNPASFRKVIFGNGSAPAVK